jgi:chemotaxis protein methyltransferase CheR
MLDENAISHLQKVVKDLYGMALGDNHLNELVGSIKKRIKELKLGSADDYLKLITYGGSSKELEHLIAKVTVGETSFFRTPQQFWALRDFVFPELCRRKKAGEKLRILSAGCATGEEPYTIGMVALESLRRQHTPEVEILAVDLNKDYLEQAREGLYSVRDLRVMDEHLKSKYFSEQGNEFQISTAVRDLVEFRLFNLAKDDMDRLCREGGFDCIFCRNVLIYFAPECFAEALQHFHAALDPRGYLFLGYSESLYGLDSSFECIYVPGTFFYQKVDQKKPVPAREFQVPAAARAALKIVAQTRSTVRPKPSREKPAVKPPEIRELEKHGAAIGRADQVMEDRLWENSWECFENEEYDKAHAGFEKLIKTDPESPLGYLGMAFILANQGENLESERFLSQSFKRDSLIPEGYYLVGLLAERCEDWEKAIENYQRAIFLKSDFTIAHFNLASLYFRLSELNNAARELKVVKEILSTQGEGIYLSGGWTQKALADWAESHLKKISELRV